MNIEQAYEFYIKRLVGDEGTYFAPSELFELEGKRHLAKMLTADVVKNRITKTDALEIARRYEVACKEAKFKQAHEDSIHNELLAAMS